MTNPAQPNPIHVTQIQDWTSDLLKATQAFADAQRQRTQLDLEKQRLKLEQQKQDLAERTLLHQQQMLGVEGSALQALFAATQRPDQPQRAAPTAAQQAEAATAGGPAVGSAVPGTSQGAADIAQILNTVGQTNPEVLPDLLGHMNDIATIQGVQKSMQTIQDHTQISALLDQFSQNPQFTAARLSKLGTDIGKIDPQIAEGILRMYTGFMPNWQYRFNPGGTVFMYNQFGETRGKLEAEPPTKEMLDEANFGSRIINNTAIVHPLEAEYPGIGQRVDDMFRTSRFFENLPLDMGKGAGEVIYPRLLAKVFGAGTPEYRYALAKIDMANALMHQDFGARINLQLMDRATQAYFPIAGMPNDWGVMQEIQQRRITRGQISIKGANRAWDADTYLTPEAKQMITGTIGAAAVPYGHGPGQAGMPAPPGWDPNAPVWQSYNGVKQKWNEAKQAFVEGYHTAGGPEWWRALKEGRIGDALGINQQHVDSVSQNLRQAHDTVNNPQPMTNSIPQPNPGQVQGNMSVAHTADTIPQHGMPQTGTDTTLTPTEADSYVQKILKNLKRMRNLQRGPE